MMTNPLETKEIAPSVLDPTTETGNALGDLFAHEVHSNSPSTATQIWLLDCDSTFPAKRLTQLNDVLAESNIVLTRLNKGKATSFQQLEAYLKPQTSTWLLASEAGLAKLATNTTPTQNVVEKAQLALEQLNKHPVLNTLQCLLFSEDPLSTALLKTYLSAGIYKAFYANLSIEQWVEQLISVVKLGEKLRNSQTFGKEQALLNEDLSSRSFMIEKELYKTRQLQQSLLPAIVENKDTPTDGGLGTSKLHYLTD